MNTMNTTTPTTAAPVCIVIARTEETAEWDGVPFAADLGHRAGVVQVRRALAAVWLLRGDAADVEKAERYCRESGDGWRVYVCPVEERDPLGRARRLALGR